jgi:hypothetical protein
MKPLTAGMHLSPMLAARDAVAALAARREGRTAPCIMTYRARPTNTSGQPASATQTNTADPACTACPKSKSTTTKSGSVRQRTS